MGSDKHSAVNNTYIFSIEIFILNIMRIIVVGAGIIGTTSAFRIKKKFPESKLTIIAAELSPNTTSDVAAGWWEPHLDPDTDSSLVNTWSSETYEMLAKLARGEIVEEMGQTVSDDMRSSVRSSRGTIIDVEGVYSQPPSWAKVVKNFQMLEPNQTKTSTTSRDSSTISGFSFDSFVWEPSKNLPIFYKWLQDNGVIIQKRNLKNMDEILDADVVVNCSGIGAATLVSDDKIFPISGHVLRVNCPLVSEMVGDNRPETWSYMIPNTDTLVLGSVDRENNWNTQAEFGDRDKILSRCSKLHPLIKESSLVSEKVGLRPCRRGGVRCELEEIEQRNTAGRKVAIIHNYGHGGSGVTLSWGCAGMVVALLCEWLGCSHSM